MEFTPGGASTALALDGALAALAANAAPATCPPPRLFTRLVCKRRALLLTLCAPPHALPAHAQVMRSTSHPIPRVLRAFSAGIILALAFVHIYPEAVDELANLEPLMNEDYPYNVAGPTAIFGALLMVALDSAANFFVERRQAQALREQLGGDEGRGAPVSESAATALAAPHAATLVLDPHTHVCAGQARMSLDATPMPRVRDQVRRLPRPPHSCSARRGVCGPRPAALRPHSVVVLLHPRMICPGAQIMAVLFELGCIFHSFIIGLTLGVNTDNYASVRGHKDWSAR